MTKDPDGGDKDDVLSQNPYAYAKGNPVRNVDPDGNLSAVLIAGGAVIGGATMPAWVVSVAIGVGLSIGAAYVYTTYFSRAKSNQDDAENEHRKKRPSTKKKHQKGRRRVKNDKWGEKGDARRPYRRK